MDEERFRAAVAYFGVEYTDRLAAMIGAISLWHHDKVMLSRDIPHLRALCGEPASAKRGDKDSE